MKPFHDLLHILPLLLLLTAATNSYARKMPEAQQTAIEQYLGVSSFPSYFLVNADGELVDIKVDARNIAGLERAIKSLK